MALIVDEEKIAMITVHSGITVSPAHLCFGRCAIRLRDVAVLFRIQIVHVVPVEMGRRAIICLHIIPKQLFPVRLFLIVNLVTDGSVAKNFRLIFKRLEITDRRSGPGPEVSSIHIRGLICNDLVLLALTGIEKRSLHTTGRFEKLLAISLIVLFFQLKSAYETKLVSYMIDVPTGPDPKTLDDLRERDLQVLVDDA
uniref:Uncharacterized protein n=1 Tax=Anopheles coluzzii TaxID=1518534 RepID=A0A8W7PJV0_ANOCL